jgi:hypothetical protein
MARRSSGLFKKGYAYSATHGSTVVPAKTYRAALKIAVADARIFNTVTQVAHRDRNPTVIATCIPEKKAGRRTIVRCHIHKKSSKGSHR